MREGGGPDGIYLVLDGAVQVTATNGQGETFLGSVRSNEVLGELGVLDGEPRSGTATALSPTVAYFIPTEPFLRLLEQSSLVSNRLLILLSGRLRVVNYRLMELGPSGPVGRRITPIAP
jgi:CRP-like cAMP-binding protein